MPPFLLRNYLYRSGRKSPFHYDPICRISIVLWGHLLEKVGRFEERASPLSVVLKSNDVKHANEYGEDGVRILSIEWAPEQPPAFLQPKGFGDWQWYHQDSRPAVLSFLRQLPHAKQTSQQEELIIDLMASLQPPQPLPFHQPPSWLSRLRERLQDEYMLPLKVQDLAADAGVHPVYLARLFRRSYGCSVKQYLQHIRLERAIYRIASSEMPLAQLAYEQGFADQPHLSRQLRSALQITPARFRKLMREVSFVQD